MDPGRPRPLKRPRHRIALSLLLVAWWSAVGAGPGGREWADDDHSHDRARRAVERGTALPVTEMLRRLQERYPGDVVATEYEFEFERWVYEFKVIDDDGRLRKIHLDAASGRVVDGAVEDNGD
ncbi:MAG: peptidase M4 [Gammaproteobacteria bacterium]|nr:peptidase M4 [Gammaproteobacteria bacterium]